MKTEARPTPAPTEPAAGPRSPLRRAVSLVWGITRFLFTLFVFVGALQLMKTGAASLDLLQPGGYLVKNAGSTLGLGWLGALLVFSGSPIAATALTLVAAGEGSLSTEAFTEIQGFTMLTGSRLGAAFVVLATAVIYALRGKGKVYAGLSTAVMALCTTALIYIPSLALGLALLKWGPFSSLDLHFPAQFADLLDVVYGDILETVSTWPAALVFLGGLGLLLLSFQLIDMVLPEMHPETMGERRAGWLEQKWPMFGLGSLVALVTMSVSVALTVLVPLVSKGYVKRENILPYIMGANITTLGDTLLAGFALDSPAAIRIVLAQMIATTILSVFLLTFFYPQVRRAIWRFQRQMVKNKVRLAAFTAGLFLIPVGIIGIAGVIG